MDTSTVCGVGIDNKLTTFLISCLILQKDATVPRELHDEAKKEIEEQATIYRNPKNCPLTDFHIRVNEAAKQLAVSKQSLVRKRGELLELARKKVADEGYCFKKGKSRSKVDGKKGDVSEPKQVKLDQSVREDKKKDMEELVADVTTHISIKEKRRDQAEKSHNYKVCDEVTQEL